ncbi:alpha/beta hydrolase [Nocardioides sp. CBS4Y-1]|uniref:Alpha/beta hydrolase n=1 Tax=Nocardioides acrostichi TaxID=2784339 RepID=A0A930UXI8_9ACTN|nr:alpha/beta hydrolase [Nocardioides acrostichi]
MIPKPDQMVSAASNVAQKTLYGGLADLRPMPRTLIDEGQLREVYHYRPQATVKEQGDPVLLVTPLAAPSLCYDLRRSCSLVEHFVTQGRPTYLVEYGEVSFKNRSLGLEHWVDEVVPTAIREVSKHAGGRPVHVVGWSLGGIFMMLAAADDLDLPIASLTVVGSPWDVSQVPMIAPLRPLLNIAAGKGPITGAYRLLGGAPKPLVRWAFQLSSFQKLITKPLAVATHLDDTDFLAQVEAVDRFTANMIAYPGRSFGQLYHRFIKGNALMGGVFELDDREIEIGAIAAPVLVFAGSTDGIAPANAVKAIVPQLTKAAEVRFEIVPGGHLGMLTGRAARTTTWQVLDEWVDQWSTDAEQDAGTRPPTSTGKAAAKAVKGARNSGSGKPRKKAASRQAIGSNPSRRHSSASSRSLAK